MDYEIEIDPAELDAVTRRLMQRAMSTPEFEQGYIDGVKVKLKSGGILLSPEKKLYQNIVIRHSRKRAKNGAN